ncbi:MAG: hypothetical protein ACXW2X_12015 [Thermoanaerobaculia bacterium]
MTMKTHFSEADLLETYYMQPGESMPVMMHLAACTDCSARYERLERKLREAAACPTEKPETFWSRQRLAIMRTIAAQPARLARIAAFGRIAATAALAFVLGGAVVYREVTRPEAVAVAPPAKTSVATAPTVDDMHAPINPWQSEELQQFHDVVQWESWVGDTPNTGGDDSL